MSLYWPPDPDDIVTDEPRLHAVVIGVGHYPHLKGGGDTRAKILSGLKQLTTTTVTARHIARWLAESHHNPECPVGSVELLISDAAGQTATRPDGSEIEVESASMSAIVKAVKKRWKKRCHTHPKNTALFYFAGHGVSKGSSQLLLASDFGEDADAPWDNCIDFERLRDGMRTSNADAQLFFVDACREYDDSVLNALHPEGNGILGGATFEDTVESQSVYRATGIGRQAFGPENEITYFAQALTEALKGVGARRDYGKPAHVDTSSLGGALKTLVTEIGKDVGKTLNCDPHPYGAPIVFHRPERPLVRTSVRVGSGASFALERDGSRAPGPDDTTPDDERPWVLHLDPGDWTLSATAPDGAPLPVQSPVTLYPPAIRIEL